MKIDRHLEEVAEAAALYTLGKLPEAEMRGFEQRIAGGCPVCQAHLEACLQTAEALLVTVEVAPDPSLKDRLMRRIEASAAPAAAPVSPVIDKQILRSQDGEWKPSPVPGVQFRYLHGKRSFLVRMEAGSQFPTHQHAFDEHCLVLEGSVQDFEGTTLYAGDFLFMPKGSKHDPIHTVTGCTFLIAYM